MLISYADGFRGEVLRAEVTPEELAQTLGESVPGEKRAQAWWSPITWTGNRRDKRAFEAASAIVLDVDKPDFDWAAVAKYGRVVVPTWGWTPGNPKSRVVLLLAEPITDVGAYQSTVRALAEATGADEECLDAARLFFYGHRNPEGTELPGAAAVFPGACVPVVSGTPTAAAPTPEGLQYAELCTETGIDIGEVGEILARTPTMFHRTRELLAGDAPMDGGRHGFGTRIIGELAEMLPRVTHEAICDFLEEHWTSHWPDGEEPRFWSHARTCCVAPSRLAKAQAELRGRQADDALQRALQEFQRKDREPSDDPAPWDVDWDATLPEPVWLSKALHLGPGRVVEVLGKGGSMKTSALMALCANVARGEDIWGVPNSAPAAPAGVLWIDGEMGSLPTRRKMQRCVKAGGPLRAPINVMSTDDMTLPLMGQPVDGSDDGFATAMGQLVEAVGAKLLVIDNLQALAYPDENSRDIRRPLDNLRAVLGERGVTVIVVHHSRKSGQNDNDKRDLGSGHSAIFNAAGTVYHLERVDDEGHVTATRTKSHSEHTGGGAPYRFVLEGQPDGRFIYRPEQAPPDPHAEKQHQQRQAEIVLRRRVLDAIGNEACTEAILLDRITGLPHGELHKHLRAMEAAGTIMDRGVGKQRCWLRIKGED